MQIREKRPTEETARKPTQPSRRLLQADTWLRNYAQHFGERQPDREEIHLPKCLSKEAIYGLYSEEMVKAKEPTLSLSAFRDMWLKRFRHLKISTV